MSGVRPTVSDVDVDLGELFASLARNWVRILTIALAVTALAFAYTRMATPQYRAETRILIENRESVFTRPNVGGGEADRPMLDEESVTSQVEVISSADILREVATNLRLATREEFGGTGHASSFGQLLVLLGLKSDPSQNSLDERVLKAMREGLQVYRIERSRVIVIQFSSRDPELAAAVPNAIADAYLAVQQQAKLLSNEDATEWLEPEIVDLRARVREAEARVAAYRSQSDLLAGQNNAPLATQQLSEMSSELTRVRAARSAAEAKAAAIRSALASGSPADTIADIQTAPLVQRLREREAQLSAEVADLSTTLLDNHPRIRGLRSQLAEVSQQLRSEVRKVLESVENEAAASRTRETSLVADLNRLKAASAQAGDDEVALRALEREASAQRALLESYLTRYREAASRGDRNYLPVDARVFARATAPFEPYFPKPVPIVGAAFVGSLLLIAVFTLLREIFSGRAMRAAPGAGFEPVEQIDMPPFHERAMEPADVPAHEAHFEESDESVDDEDLYAGPPPVAVDDPREDLREERDELTVEEAAERLIAGGAARAIFVSPEGDEATATSVMVAREIADAGLRVIFVDLTYSGAPSASMLDSSRFQGITNLLVSEAQFSDIIRGDLYSDCHVIPVGTADPQSAMRAVDRLPIIMESLTTAYDLVVVECGPSDAQGIGRVVGEAAEILVSVIEPADTDVAATAANLAEGGYDNLLKVSPVGYSRPNAPSGRSVA